MTNCKHCKGKPSFEKEYGMVRLKCTCGQVTRLLETEDEATDVWNQLNTSETKND